MTREAGQAPSGNLPRPSASNKRRLAAARAKPGRRGRGRAEASASASAVQSAPPLTGDRIAESQSPRRGRDRQRSSTPAHQRGAQNGQFLFLSCRRVRLHRAGPSKWVGTGHKYPPAAPRPRPRPRRARGRSRRGEEEGDRGAEIPAGAMAKGSGERGALLPVSADDGKGNGGGDDDAVLFKGSAMTRRGAAAALSYMACSGTRCARSAPSPTGGLVCLLVSAAVAPPRGLLAVRDRVGCFVRRVRGIWGRESTCTTCLTCCLC